MTIYCERCGKKEKNEGEFLADEETGKYYCVPCSTAVISKIATNEHKEGIDEPTKYVSGGNGVATAIRIIAWLTYIGGFILGIVFGVDSYEIGMEFFTVAIIYWVIGFVEGTVLLGFAEIINLLQRIADKRK